jgi:hypothetical protein
MVLSRFGPVEWRLVFLPIDPNQPAYRVTTIPGAMNAAAYWAGTTRFWMTLELLDGNDDYAGHSILKHSMPVN